MGTLFRGWPEQAYTVLLQLDGEPSAETRERVRRDREAQVRQPMIDLLSDLADVDSWYEDFAVWRYASTAFWWQNQCAIVRVARNVYIGFRFSLDGLGIGACWRYASSESIALFRAAVAADGTGRALEDLVVSLAADGHEILGDVMSRVPRGYPAGHPRASLLRHRSLIANREVESEAIHDVEPVYHACERLRPLLTWLAEHTVAPPEAAEAPGRSGASASDMAQQLSTKSQDNCPNSY
jgi:hypothetical protein